MKYIITLFSILLLLSCGQDEIKKIKESYKNGQPKFIYYYKNKSDTLTYRKEMFYESGKVNYIGNIVNKKKEGVWTWWYENGKTKDKCKYLDGFYVDTVFHWYENGTLQQIEIVEGRRVRTDGCCNCNGTVIRYHKNGKLDEKFTRINDKLQGKSVQYYENGGWEMHTYKNDTLNGPAIEHFLDSTQTILVGQFENGKETGLWKEFNKDSILTLTTIFTNGTVNGEQIQYYPSGKIKQKGIVKEGEYQGEVNYYNELGKLTKTEFYKLGKLQRESKF